VAGGFPSGQFHLQSRLLEIELAIADGAVEIDAVINRAAVLESNWQLLFDEITKMEEICREKAKLKIILSTGELGTKENIYNAAMAAMCAGNLNK
jgi:deoxyribose-phosphate aldolase